MTAWHHHVVPPAAPLCRIRATENGSNVSFCLSLSKMALAT